MGQAILAGAFRAGVLLPGDVLFIDVDEERRRVGAEMGCAVGDDFKRIDKCAEILLAVKPQSFEGVAKGLGRLKRSTVVISIMAGLGSEKIREGLGEMARVVRVMPNTPCRVGMGVTGIALGAGAAPGNGDDDLAVRLFEGVGEVVRVEESLMHAVTAVSGSGPAYVFLLAEAMEEAAKLVGMSEGEARVFVGHTIAGAGKMLIENGAVPRRLREAVTSKGGTTAAALAVFEEEGFREMVGPAVQAAKERGEEMGSI